MKNFCELIHATCYLPPKAYHTQNLPSNSPKLLLQLLCLPADLVKSVYKTANLGAATPEDVAIAISNINTEWPIQGALVVEVNSNKSCGKTWLPRHLVSCVTRNL
jgi:hypothetical protein